MYRQKCLSAAPVDITPKNGATYPWAGQDLAKYENEMSFKPVTIRGMMDFNRDVKVLKWKNGEKGVEVITPFYTHLNAKEQPCGILVNRGWFPWDLKDWNYDKHNSATLVKGVLYRGDPETKYS